MPATPAIAQRPFCSSALRYLQQGATERAVNSLHSDGDGAQGAEQYRWLPGCGAACLAACCCPSTHHSRASLFTPRLRGSAAQQEQDKRRQCTSSRQGCSFRAVRRPAAQLRAVAPSAAGLNKGRAGQRSIRSLPDWPPPAIPDPGRPRASHMQPLPGAPRNLLAQLPPCLPLCRSRAPPRLLQRLTKAKVAGHGAVKVGGRVLAGLPQGASGGVDHHRGAAGLRAEEAAAEVTHGALAGETRGSGASQTPDRHTGCRKGAALGPLQNPLPARGRQPAGWSAGRR
jgi:hypothetical protein